MKYKREKKKTHASGEKCATQLFTEMHVGNARPAPQRERKKHKNENKINQSSSHYLGRGRRRRTRTFEDFDSFNRLVVHGAGTFFDKLIAFDTEIEDVCTLHE